MNSILSTTLLVGLATASSISSFLNQEADPVVVFKYIDFPGGFENIDFYWTWEEPEEPLSTEALDLGI